MKLFVYGFWSGFIEKTNPVNITFFIDLLKNVFNEEIELGDINESDILLETIFEKKTRLFDKQWKYSFLFSGLIEGLGCSPFKTAMADSNCFFSSSKA